MASVAGTPWVPLTSQSINHSINGKTDHLPVRAEENMSSTWNGAAPTNRNSPLVTEGDLDNRRHKAFTPLISERAVDQPRPLKVIYIGAGISGILAAIKFREAVPNLSLTIYEKNPDLGGTWYENKYPGCACGKQGKTLCKPRREC